MKKTLCLLLAVTALLLFSACGSNASVKLPDDDLIRTDIQKSLSEYHAMQGACALEVQEHQLTKSLTEDKVYSAEFTVTAESKYAQFHYIANITYTLYDQGWIMDSCEWTYVDYEVVRYPGENDLEDLDNREEVEALENPVFTGETNILQASSLITTDWSPYAIGRTERVTRWTYNSHSDRWDYLDTAIHNSKVELTDAGAEFLRDTLNTNNFTGTGFDVASDNQYFKVDTTHVELDADQCFCSEDKMLLHFQSSNDRAFYNKDKECDSEGYMMVRLELFREPEKTPSLSSYDMVVWLTMVDDTWVAPYIYSIPIHHFIN